MRWINIWKVIMKRNYVENLLWELPTFVVEINAL